MNAQLPNQQACRKNPAVDLLRVVLWWGLLLLTIWGCQPSSQPVTGSRLQPDSNAVYRLTDIGDSLYARKQTYRNFADAMVYYDSAARLAEGINDTAVKGYVLFCKASVYNAWNKEPQRTIQLFKEAAAIYSQGPDWESRRRQFYCWYLVAHAYDNDKGHDSSQCVKTLYQIRDSLQAMPRQRWQHWKFLADLAWVATNVANYSLAQQLLAQLTQRRAIVNDPNTNNYLDHYYLTQARIAVYLRHDTTSPYLDSLQEAYRAMRVNFDKLYHGENLARLYAACGHYQLAYSVSLANGHLNTQLTDSAGISSLQNRLLQAQLASEHKDSVLADTRHRNRIRLLWLLSGSVLLIGYVSYRFWRGQLRYQTQSQQLAGVNQQLDEKVNEIELLNKEMQHRIKNNLQMIQSLIYMQQRHTDSQEVKENMQQMGLRIQSIASLHEQLTQTRDAPIDLQAYLSRMLHTVVNLIDRQQRVITHFSVDPVDVPLKQSFPLGLILNEWMTNSLKYAAAGEQTLSIHLTIRQEADALLIDYYDSGRVDPSHKPPAGLGLRIIELLTSQLKASLTTDPQNAYHYRLLIDGK